jgi:hypothetical protein
MPKSSRTTVSGGSHSLGFLEPQQIGSTSVLGTRLDILVGQGNLYVASTPCYLPYPGLHRCCVYVWGGILHSFSKGGGR